MKTKIFYSIIILIIIVLAVTGCNMNEYEPHAYPVPCEGHITHEMIYNSDCTELNVYWGLSDVTIDSHLSDAYWVYVISNRTTGEWIYFEQDTYLTSFTTGQFSFIHIGDNIELGICTPDMDFHTFGILETLTL